MSAANTPETLTVEYPDGERATLPYRTAVGLLSLQRATLVTAKSRRRGGRPRNAEKRAPVETPAPDAPVEAKPTDDDLIGLSTPEGVTADQEGVTTENTPSEAGPSDDGS